MKKVAVVIPNWNGMPDLGKCLESILKQTYDSTVIVVDNGSIDDSVEFIHKNYPDIELITNRVNKGFTGGVNPGLQQAIDDDLDYVALLNNDAAADKYWLQKLVDCLETKPKVGIATPKIVSLDGKHIDSTGDFYTTWGLPYPRGRDETEINKYDNYTEVFAGSGGASMYRLSMIKEIGLFDQLFFAYYEDIDLSFRAQLAGWKVNFVPDSVVYHGIGATSSKIKGFTTYQTIKNLPILLLKNVPLKQLPIVYPRFILAHSLFFVRAISRGQFIPALRGVGAALVYSPLILRSRFKIQKNKKVTDEYIWSIMTHDLPPNARALRELRDKWHKAISKS